MERLSETPGRRKIPPCETADRAAKLELTTLEYWARYRLAEIQAQGGMTDALRTGVKQLEASARESGHQLVARKAGLLLAARG